MKRRVIGIAAVVLIVLVAGGGFYLATRPTTVQLKLQAYDFFFMDASGKQNPTITVRVGDTIVITIENKATKLQHEFFVVRQDEFNKYVDAISKGQDPKEPDPVFKEASIEDIAAGETKSGTFVAEQAGTYVYACLTHDGTRPLIHAHKGMYATFQVQQRTFLQISPEWLAILPFSILAPLLASQTRPRDSPKTN